MYKTWEISYDEMRERARDLEQRLAEMTERVELQESQLKWVKKYCHVKQLGSGSQDFDYHAVTDRMITNGAAALSATPRPQGKKE